MTFAEHNTSEIITFLLGLGGKHFDIVSRENWPECEILKSWPGVYVLFLLKDDQAFAEYVGCTKSPTQSLQQRIKRQMTDPKGAVRLAAETSAKIWGCEAINWSPVGVIAVPCSAGAAGVLEDALLGKFDFAGNAAQNNKPKIKKGTSVALEGNSHKDRVQATLRSRFLDLKGISPKGVWPPEGNVNLTDRNGLASEMAAYFTKLAAELCKFTSRSRGW